jgi:anti-sigma-K factor RskA
MVGPDHLRYREDAGAYLLGALPELETRAFEKHVMSCSECRDELERLRPAAEALPRSVERFAAPPTLKRSLMAAVEADARAAGRRRILALPRPALARPQTALATAAAVLLVGAAIGFGVDRATRGGESRRVIAAQVDRSRFSRGKAELELQRGGRFAMLTVHGLPALPAGKVYEVWIERGGRVRPTGALFEVTADGRGAAAIPGGVRGARAVLVTREPSGGSLQPTERPPIRVRI